MDLCRKCRIGHEEYMGDEKKIIHANNFEDAARRYGQWYDVNTADYAILEGDEIVVTVTRGDVTKKFEITGQAEPTYRAKEVD